MHLLLLPTLLSRHYFAERLSYNSFFIPRHAVSIPIVQAQTLHTPTTCTLPAFSQDPFKHNALNQYNSAIRQLMHEYSQLQLTNSRMVAALPVLPVVPAHPVPHISF